MNTALSVPVHCHCIVALNFQRVCYTKSVSVCFIEPVEIAMGVKLQIRFSGGGIPLHSVHMAHNLPPPFQKDCYGSKK